MRKYKLLLFILFLLAADLQAQDIRSVKITEVAQLIAESKTPLIINMWATWCKPCIEELPYFLEEVNQYNKTRGTGDSIQLILVSLDFEFSYPEGIKKFAAKRNITAPILWLNETNADYFCPKIDAKWSGAIPATLFINNKSGYRHFVEEQISHEQLNAAIKAILQ